MKKHKESFLFWFITWIVLAFVFVFFLGFGTSRAIATQPSEYELKVGPVLSRSKIFSEKMAEYSHCSTNADQLYFPMVADPLYGEELYRFYIAQINEQYYPAVDPYIALAVLEIESNYRPDLMSSAGAVGLMQWIPKYHAWRMDKFHLNDMWDPYTNIIVGMDYLNDLYSASGSWREALYGYNHSTYYVRLVLERAEELREGGWFG